MDKTTGCRRLTSTPMPSEPNPETRTMPKHKVASLPASDRHAGLPEWMVAAYFAPASAQADGVPATIARDARPGSAEPRHGAHSDVPLAPGRAVSRGGIDGLMYGLHQTWPQAGGDHVLPTGSGSRNRQHGDTK